MTAFQRYAIYWLPEGDLSVWAESWLGWSMAQGRPLPRPQVDGLPRDAVGLTAAATAYGLHATIKPPFRLAPGHSAADLDGALAAFCARHGPVGAATLDLTDLDGFLALTPVGDTTGLDALAGGIVAALDIFRAPAPADEIARRRAAGLTPRQDLHLMRWGYPYVMADFGFHVTLTGRLSAADAAATAAALRPLVMPLLPRPLRVNGLALVGQATDGFRLITHHALTG